MSAYLLTKLRLGFACVLGGCMVSAAGLSSLFAQEPLPAQDLTPAERCRRATVLVEVESRGHGSGFCIHPAGVFLTNDHLLSEIGLGGTVTITVDTGDKYPRTAQARIIGLWKEAGLAALQTTGLEKLTALTFGDPEGLDEAAPVTVYGFPAEKRPTAEDREYPSLGVFGGRVGALRFQKGELQAMQVEAVVDSGIVGGPVVDEQGRVLGIVTGADMQSGAGVVMPANRLQAALSRPLLLLNLPRLPFADRQRKLPFRIEVVEFVKGSAPDALKFTIRNEKGDERTLVGQKTESGFLVEVAPIDEASPAARFHVKARVAGSPPDAKPADIRLPENRRAETEDVTLQVGGREFRLSEVRRIERRPELQIVTFLSGKKLAGTVTGLERLPWNGTAAVDPATFGRVDVYAVEPGPLKVDLTVVGERAGQPVAEVKARTRIEDVPLTYRNVVYDTADPRASGLDDFVIEVRIDGQDQLAVSPGGLRWQHLTYNKPGDQDGDKRYLKIDDFRWSPVWQNSAVTDTTGDFSDALAIKFAPGKWTAELISIRELPDSENDLKRGALKTWEQGPILWISFHDPAPGSALFKVRVRKVSDR